MFNWFKKKEKKVEVNNIEVLNSDIRKIRLLQDVIDHKQTVDSKKPDLVNENENVFKQGFKKVKNSINEGSYKTALANLNEKVELYNSLSEEKIDNDTTYDVLNSLLEKYSEEATKLASLVFENDKLKLGKMEFAINMAFDTFANFATSEKAYEKISTILGEEEGYMKGVKDNLLDAFNKINVKINTPKNPVVVAGLITGVVLGAMVNPVAGVATIAFTTLGMAESVLALCGVSSSTVAKDLANTAYDKVNFKVQSKVLKDEFYKLDLSQMTFSLAKSIVMIIELNKYRKEDNVAEDLYCAYIENYIDIKSDVTLKLLMDVDSKDNYEKSKVFNNVDKYLVTKLQLA